MGLPGIACNVLHFEPGPDPMWQSVSRWSRSDGCDEQRIFGQAFCERKKVVPKGQF